MKLYECPRNIYIRALESLPNPPASIAAETGGVYLFHNLDGMFSRCTDKFGSIVHIHASTEVEVVNEIT